MATREADFCPLNPGETQTADFPPDVRGAEYAHKNLQKAPGTASDDGRTSIVRLCKNESGAAILPGRTVSLRTAGNEGWGIDALGAANGIHEGVVDPHLPSAGVADDDWCLVIVEGPCRVVTDGNNAISVGEELIGVAAGEVDQASADPPAVQDIQSYIGIAEEAAGAASTTIDAVKRRTAF